MDKKSIFRTFRLYLVITIGSIVAALGYALFQVPHGIAAGGVSGIAILVNHFTGWQVGAMVWLMNVPILVLGMSAAAGVRAIGDRCDCRARSSSGRLPILRSSNGSMCELLRISLLGVSTVDWNDTGGRMGLSPNFL